MVTTPLCTYFSDRATISGHDNPVFNNLADVEVYSRQMLSGEHYNGFEEQLEEKHLTIKIQNHNLKKVITNELFFLHHKFYTTHRTVLKIVAIIMYAEASNVEPNTSLC